MGRDDTLSGGGEGASSASTEGPRRRRLAGRYELLEEVGAGGAGVVYRAFDRELERRVAVKLLRQGRPRGVSSTRLRREARANALLQHPNVVSVFDVGEDDGEVFIAMEYVGGGSLKAWLEQPRSPSEILDAFRQAGEGLLAAHAKGIVHRDFKPSNVLMGADGRPRVADFGLARAFQDGERAAAASLQARGLVDLSLTHTGTVLGTPAYMAPEQFVGGPVDPRTDQFAFCLSLAEALVGVAPPRNTTTALGEAPEHWDTRAWLRTRRLPVRLREALARGLSVEPDARYPSLRSVLDAIDAALGRSAAPRGWAWATAGLLGGAVAAFVAYSARPDPRFEGVPTAVPSPEARRLLWVDDNPRYNHTEIEHLRDAGWALELALTMEEAVRKGSFDQYAAILSDMERQNAEHFDLSAGIALIRKVRASGSKTPVIIYTSSHLVDVLRDTVREAGGTAIVGTPSALYDEIEIAVGEP